MLDQSNKLEYYTESLDSLYRDFVRPMLDDRESSTPLFDWGSSPSSFGVDTLTRCDFDTYKSIKEQSKKIGPVSDAVALAYPQHEAAIEHLNEIINILGRETGIDNLGLSNKPLYYKKHKDYNGFMGWHTNCDNPGHRWYFVYNTDNHSSFFRYIDPDTEQMVTKWEPKGWCLNHFIVGDCHKPLWHCVYTNSHRVSFGIRQIASLNLHKWKNIVLM